MESSPTGRDTEVPLVISVDDHVLEPRDLWTSRLPDKYREVGPRVVRRRTVTSLVDKKKVNVVSDGDEGAWCDWWLYEDQVRFPLLKEVAAIGFDLPDPDPTTYDEVASSCWNQADRLADMTKDHIEASLCFPNTISRFCGQTFYEGKDKELGLLCVQAYNDWILDEWCAGEGYGRLVPITLIPLWDIDLAVREIERCAAKGSVAISFSENPNHLKLPTLYSDHWERIYAACAHHELMMTMHIGSSSYLPMSSPDTPRIIRSLTHFTVTAQSLLDFIFAGILERHPKLKTFYAESQAGWMPYLLEQCDYLWELRQGMTLGSDLPNPPSSYLKNRVYTSIFNDTTTLRNRDVIGMSQICFETDYPHSIHTFPNTREIIAKLAADNGLSQQEIYQLARGNAIAGFGLQRIGISS